MKLCLLLFNIAAFIIGSVLAHDGLRRISSDAASVETSKHLKNHRHHHHHFDVEASGPHHHDHHRHHHNTVPTSIRELEPIDDADAIEGLCTSPESDDVEVDPYDQVLDNWSATQEENHRRLGGTGPPPLTRIDLAPWKTVPTVIHILTGATPEYGVNPTTQQQIDEQMEMWNREFAPGKFYFDLVNVTYTENDWYYKPVGVPFPVCCFLFFLVVL